MTAPSRAAALASIDFDALVADELPPLDELDADQRAVVAHLLASDLHPTPRPPADDLEAEITREILALVPEPPTADAALVVAALRATQLTRAALARALDVHYSDVSRWLAGKQRVRGGTRRLLQFLAEYPSQARPLAALPPLSRTK